MPADLLGVDPSVGATSSLTVNAQYLAHVLSEPLGIPEHVINGYMASLGRSPQFMPRDTVMLLLAIIASPTQSNAAEPAKTIAAMEYAGAELIQFPNPTGFEWTPRLEGVPRMKLLRRLEQDLMMRIEGASGLPVIARVCCSRNLLLPAVILDSFVTTKGQLSTYRISAIFAGPGQKLPERFSANPAFEDVRSISGVVLDFLAEKYRAARVTRVAPAEKENRMTHP